MADIRAEVQAAVEQEQAAVEQAEAAKAAEKKPGAAKRTDFNQLAQDLHDNFVGDARRYVNRFKNKLAFDNTEQKWYRHNCTRWIPDKERAHLQAVAELAPDFEHQADYWRKQATEAEAKGSDSNEVKQLEGRAKKYAARADRLKDPANMNKVLTLAGAGGGSLGISGDEWNKHPTLFACQNCILDLETGRAMDPDPKLYISQASATEWRGLHQEAPDWEAFLQQIFLGDEELIEYVQMLCGYWLTGLTTIQEFWVLFGPLGRNGKGVFFRTLRAIMGNYYASIPAAMLTESKMTQGGGPSPELVNLRFSRLAVASEVSKRARISEESLKIYSGGDPIACRSMYSNTILEFVPMFKILFAMNRIPGLDGADTALRARFITIPFRAHFSSDPDKLDPDAHIYPIDPFLERKLHTPDGLSQVLSWCVRGAVKFFRVQIPQKPTVVIDESTEALDDQDPIGEFIRTCLTITDGQDRFSRTQGAAIYDTFVKWCKEEKRMSDKYIKSLTVFGADFKNRHEIKLVPPKNIRNYNVIIKPEWIADQTV